MTHNAYDSIVIGGGSAGMAFATAAAKLGARILVIERAELGGTCVNRGCVPKKILWSAGQIARTTRAAAAQNIATKTVIDYQALIAKRDAHIADIRDIYAGNLDDAGVALLRGQAAIIDARTVDVGDTTYTANQIILACGGRPAEMNIPGAALLSNSNDVLGWTTRPDRITIIGGGYIGCEFAAIFHALGSDVTLIHNGPHLLDTFPKNLALHVQNGLASSGIRIRTEDGVTAVKQTGTSLGYTCASGLTDTADAVVAAAGRTPNIDQLGQFAETLVVADTGALAISDQFETSQPGVYAIGDIADRLPLTPVATADGTALAHMLYGNGAEAVDLDLVATTTFVYPPAAFVGETSIETLRSGDLTPLAQNVLSDVDHNEAFYQINAERDILRGAAIAAHGAEDIIAMAAALIAAKAPVTSLTKATPVHPSFAEEYFTEQPRRRR
ncbi:Glutathione amide reductase (plasmid) [Roseobacter fucihabitans]|uniref:Glutathione amide reductase n=1 Tax=Roseobacter fucihabitans TaxID=1537242 RepID=A0ABZ2BZQ0_9RHOB|nr:FAD-dependent oxidoreductase [Roseobacter litoralis]MBC6967965.1 Glutathione amide reductase [Roseobacter litoralis]